MSGDKQKKLRDYVELIKKWNKTYNLISGKDLKRIWSRHIDDSLAILNLFPEEISYIVDIGTGCGLPGVPIKIYRPNIKITLVEKNEKRCAFLRFVRAELGLKETTIFQGDALKFRPDPRPDLVISRATFPPAKLLEISLPIIKPQGYLIVMYGKDEIVHHEFYDIVNVDIRTPVKKNVLYQKKI